VYSDGFSNLVNLQTAATGNLSPDEHHAPSTTDLVIDQVVTPSSAFRVRVFQFNTGRNNGTGDIDETATWKDRIKSMRTDYLLPENNPTKLTSMAPWM
jgi:hypothetical protein